MNGLWALKRGDGGTERDFNPVSYDGVAISTALDLFSRDLGIYVIFTIIHGEGQFDASTSRSLLYASRASRNMSSTVKL